MNKTGSPFVLYGRDRHASQHNYGNREEKHHIPKNKTEIKNIKCVKTVRIRRAPVERHRMPNRLFRPGQFTGHF